MVRPFESSCFSGHLVFSHGHYILNAGYDVNYDNVFSWEEPYQTYLTWKAGYKLYAMHESVIWHSYHRAYRPRFQEDGKHFSKSKKKSLETKVDPGKLLDN